MTRPTQHPAPNSTARKAETERRANLTVVPCCDAAAAVARVEALVESMSRTGYPDALLHKGSTLLGLRAALDGGGS